MKPLKYYLTINEYALFVKECGQDWVDRFCVLSEPLGISDEEDEEPK